VLRAEPSRVFVGSLPSLALAKASLEAAIQIPCYNIPPILGSLHRVLASPDTEIVLGAQIFTGLSLHEDLVQSGQKNVAKQLSTPY